VTLSCGDGKKTYDDKTLQTTYQSHEATLAEKHTHKHELNITICMKLDLNCIYIYIYIQKAESIKNMLTHISINTKALKLINE